MSPVAFRRGAGWYPLAGLAGLAGWLYQPWHARAFDVLDFSEFLPLLNGSQSASGRFAALTHYYAGTHGRFNILSYAALAAKWSWIGPHPLIWQLARAALLCGIAGMTFLLLRRLASGTLGAVLGASLLLFSYSAALPWVRLTMGEPLGLCCALLAALAATRLETRDRGWGLGILAGLLLVAAILAKEMLVCWTPVVMLIALTRAPDGRLTLWRRDRAIRRFLLATALGALGASLAVIVVARSSHGTGYSSTYGAAPLGAARLLELYQRQLLPWPITGQSDGLVMLAAGVSFLAVLCAGFRKGLHEASWRRHGQVVLLLGLGLPLMGALAYFPWPLYAAFYGYPFLFGSALLLATALTFWDKQPHGLTVAAGASAAVLVLTIPHTIRLAATAAAQQEVMTGLAQALPAARGASRIVAAVVRLPVQDWQGIGPSLVRYATAMNPTLRLPPASDILCNEAGRLLQQEVRGVVLVSVSFNCGSIPGATRVIRSDFRYWQWQPPRWDREVVRGELLVR